MALAPPSSLRRVAALVAIVALAVAFSCKTFTLTNEICDPSRVDALRNAGEPSDGECSRCLEDHCCDRVGVCGSKEHCADIVKSVHTCVLQANQDAGGAVEEQSCANENHLRDNPEADDTYRCMREQCGPSCQLPVCQVDPATVLFQNAACDRCFSGACCSELKECYGSRACKLTVECIAQCENAEPPRDGGLGPPDAGSGVFDVSEADLCADDGGVKHVPRGPPACVAKCLCRFKDNDQGLEPPDAGQRPFNLASRVYNCGYAHNCLAACTRGPDDPDGGAR